MKRIIYFLMICIFFFTVSCDDTDSSDTIRRVNSVLVMTFQQGMYPTADYGRAIDSHINYSSPGSNYGGSDQFLVGAYGGTIYRAFIKFDVSDIAPAGIEVVKAYLTIGAAGSVGTAPSVTAYRVTSEWEEGEVTWVDRTSSALWASAGGDMSGSSVSDAMDPEGKITFDLDADMVEEWIMDYSTNHGVVITAFDETTANGYIGFNSTEYVTDITWRPKLTVYYRLVN